MMINIWELYAELVLSEVAELGYRCEAKVNDAGERCCGMAVSIIFWPGGDGSKQCRFHVAKARSVANVLGFHLHYEPLPVWTAPVEVEDASAERFRQMELE